MKRFGILATATLALLGSASVAFAQQKPETVRIEIVAPKGYDYKKMNRTPSTGWAQWCGAEVKGTPTVDTDSPLCKTVGKKGEKECPHVCVFNGQIVPEPAKNMTAKR